MEKNLLIVALMKTCSCSYICTLSLSLWITMSIYTEYWRLLSMCKKVS